MHCISSPIKCSQLSAETPSNRLMLPKKGKTIGYKPRLRFLIVAGHLSERILQKTSENGSLNTKPNELKKHRHKRKKQTPWRDVNINKLVQWSVLILPCNQQLYLFCVKNRKNRLAYRWRNTVIFKDERKKPDRVINKHIWLFISYILAKKCSVTI